MSDTEREYPELPELAALNKADLLDWADKLEVTGRSTMSKPELEAALTEVVTDRQTDESLEDSPTVMARIDAIEARLASLEGRVGALDERTLGSTTLMGS